MNTKNPGKSIIPKNTKSSEETNTGTAYFEIDLGHKKVMARKWKAKDRKNFKKSVKVTEDVDVSIINELVINCLKNPDEALSYEELQFILIEIRKHSISDKINFEYKCSACERDNKVEVKIDDINKPQWKKWETVNGVEFGDIKNAKFYKENKDTEDDVKEIAFHTLSINGDVTMTFNEIVNYFDEMDIDEFDTILEKYNEMKFTVDNTKEFTCQCGHKQTFEFDEIPGFFPDSWLK